MESWKMKGGNLKVTKYVLV